MFTITQNNNFVRIFRMPSCFPKGFCFAGGHITEFILVDWFQPVHLIGASIVITAEANEIHKENLRKFIKEKTYYDPVHRFIAIAEYGDAFII